MKNLILALIVIFVSVWSPGAVQETSTSDLADKYLSQTISCLPENGYFVDMSPSDHSGFSSNKL